MIKRVLKNPIIVFSVIAVASISIVYLLLFSVKETSGFEPPRRSLHDEIIKAKYWFLFDDEKVRPFVLERVNRISDFNKLDSSALGPAGAPSAKHGEFEKLSQEATSDELRELIFHPSGVVRIYALWSFLLREESDRIQYGKKLFADHTTIITHSGCIVSHRKVGDVALELFTPRHGFGPYKINFSQKEWDELYEAMNSVDKDYYGIAAIMPFLSPKESLYISHRRYYLANKKPDDYLPLLAKYHKDQDLNLINDNDAVKINLERKRTRKGYSEGTSLLRAISNNPHEMFYHHLDEYQTALVEYSSPDESEAFYEALLAYNKKDVEKRIIDFYHATLAKKYSSESSKEWRRKNELTAIRNAISKYPNEELLFFVDEHD